MVELMRKRIIKEKALERKLSLDANKPESFSMETNLFVWYGLRGCVNLITDSSIIDNEK